MLFEQANPLSKRRRDTIWPLPAQPKNTNITVMRLLLKKEKILKELLLKRFITFWGFSCKMKLHL